MSSDFSDNPSDSVGRSRERLPGRRTTILILLLTYVGTAYLIMPEVWHERARRHPSLANVPGVTQTRSGIHGDPLNVALVGTEKQLIQIMIHAGWYPADPITLRSSLRIAADTVFRREYVNAPVSSLYLFGRKEDLAFEQPVGRDPKKRHHVRFWQAPGREFDGRPLWLGAATFDERVGFSHTTGQITHHISGNIDAERDHLMETLEATGDLIDVSTEVGFHKIRQGRNGGGDRWWTDGNLRVGVINPNLSGPN